MLFSVVPIFPCRKVFLCLTKHSPESPRGAERLSQYPAYDPFLYVLSASMLTIRQCDRRMNEENEKDQDVELDLSEEGLEDDTIIELSPEDPLYTQLDEECNKSNELLGRLQRLQAEFDNYRKRMDTRFSEVAKYASESILLKVLDVYDNILRALEMDFANDPQAAKEGISAIAKQIDKVLALEDVRPIESIGMQFDPYYQHAVQKVHDPDKKDGEILEEYQKGYMLKEKVLRPAVVCVNRHEEPTVEANNDEEKDDHKEGAE